MEVLEVEKITGRQPKAITENDLIAEYGFFRSVQILDRMLAEALIRPYEYKKIMDLTKKTFPSKFMDLLPEIA